MAFGKKYVYSFINNISYMLNEDFYKGINKNTIDNVQRYFELQPFFISKTNKKPIISLIKFKEILNKPSKDISNKELNIICKMYKITTNNKNKKLIKIKSKKTEYN